MMGEVYLGRGTVRTQDYTGHHHYSRSHIPDITVADFDGRGSTLVVEVSVFRVRGQSPLLDQSEDWYGVPYA